MRHNNILNRYLPAFLYLPGTTLLLRASARELPVPFLRLWYGAAEDRTCDLPIPKRTLYHLSYRGRYGSKRYIEDFLVQRNSLTQIVFILEENCYTVLLPVGFTT